ncbi:hypothetical protein GCM10027423_13750 [Spirosoma arcticum]
MNSVFILLGILLLIELVSWSIAHNIKLKQVHDAGGFLPYTGLIFYGLFLPELITLIFTIAFVNRSHLWLKINAVRNDWASIGQYELKFLPILALSFWFFNPFTQTVRFLIKHFPEYSLQLYWSDFIIDTYSWALYFKYLFPVILMGYVALNISLLSDFLKQRREAQEAAEAEATRAAQETLALSATFIPKPATPSPYLNHLKGKNPFGELDFPTSDVYFFTIEDRSYYAELAKGRYAVVKTLNELEAELDPGQFFRVKRDYIVNRHAVLNYAYWENGKYIVRLNTPDRHEIVVPRARMQIFREWLQENQQSLPERKPTGSYA